MKRSRLISLAAVSLLLTVAALADSRPHYGGTLRISVRETSSVLDPAVLASSGLSNVSRLTFETLVSLNDRGQPQPLLANSWEPEPGNQRWRFSLRSGVLFHDGSLLDAATVAACLRSGNPEWKVLPDGNSVVIETGSDDPYVPEELALARNGIERRGGDQYIGTGPFAITEWVSGKHLSLRANDQYWGGRPFLDAVEVDFGKNDRDQMIAFDLGKTDVAEIAAENIRRARAEGRTVLSSQPEELLALVFSAAPKSDDDLHTRNALALSLDAAAISDVVLQGGAEPSGALLPSWLSGYGFIFSAERNPEHARQEHAQAGHFLPLTLSYDANDPIARIIAERVLLNARDTGITLQLNTSSNADVRLARFALHSLDPHLALIELANALQLPAPKFNSNSITDLYAAEKGLLESHRVIPIGHLSTAVTLRPNVRDWHLFSDSTWRVDDVWLSPEKP